MAAEGGKGSLHFLALADQDKVISEIPPYSPEGELQADQGPQPCCFEASVALISANRRQRVPDRARVADGEQDGTSVVEQGDNPINELDGPSPVDSEGTPSNGRERLKRHRSEVAGRIWIPEIWGQEELLKDWVDCTVFDSSLVPSKIMLAKAALVKEARRAPSPVIHVENRCRR
ncbi:hypothetical protein MLD38_016014 [Melastoma candidum]|uniref:Uncharacterized protein n=1 Tax=Melastoma candidum TaxID=119954 RepID=A0ACB9RI35_9MYRT|nr:hypothetical protein MLD38_016014 [Melastoma candidum]